MQDNILSNNPNQFIYSGLLKPAVFSWMEKQYGKHGKNREELNYLTF